MTVDYVVLENTGEIDLEWFALGVDENLNNSPWKYAYPSFYSCKLLYNEELNESFLIPLPSSLKVALILSKEGISSGEISGVLSNQFVKIPFNSLRRTPQFPENWIHSKPPNLVNEKNKLIFLGSDRVYPSYGVVLSKINDKISLGAFLDVDNVSNYTDIESWKVHYFSNDLNNLANLKLDFKPLRLPSNLELGSYPRKNITSFNIYSLWGV
jgi:hypothetical protein